MAGLTADVLSCVAVDERGLTVRGRTRYLYTLYTVVSLSPRRPWAPHNTAPVPLVHTILGIAERFRHLGDGDPTRTCIGYSLARISKNPTDTGFCELVGDGLHVGAVAVDG